jgi:SAM-dependent methyltransferase
MAQICIARRLFSLWPDISGRDVLTLGYGISQMEPWRQQARRLVGAMPARQGVEQWPVNGPVKTLLVDPQNLPFADNCFDRILVQHLLEEAPDPLRALVQVCRTLTASGRVVVVVPHRIGLWSASEKTPFGRGRSFSYFQMQQLMEQAGLTMTARTQALFAPPHHWFASANSIKAWERTGEIFWPFLGGVLLVEATKIRKIDPRQRARRRVFCPEPSP